MTDSQKIGTGVVALIVEDEVSICDIIEYHLSKEGYTSIKCYDGAKGLEIALTQNPDIIILDVMLPSMDGFSVLKELRKTSDVPVVMLTAREEEIDIINGLDLGADDYITKPFRAKEFLARVRANLRKVKKPQELEISKDLEYGNFKIDKDYLRIIKDGDIIELTIKEYSLLKFLASNPNKLFTREEILDSVWNNPSMFGDIRTVDVTINRLRNKIEINPLDPRYLITKRGVGYYFNAG